MPSSHLTSTAQALYRVFILPTQLTKNLTHPLPLQHPPHRRTFSLTTPHRAKTRPPEQRTEKWDEEIPGQSVYLVDPETGEIASRPTTKFDILRNLDRKTHRLVQVAEGVNVKDVDGGGGGGSKEDTEVPSDLAGGKGTFSPFGFSRRAAGTGLQERERAEIPVCKIISKKAYHQTLQQRKEASKQKKKLSNLTSSVKTLELNWAIDSNDLSHRLDKIQTFLTEGRRVEVLLAAKKRGRKASEAECDQVLERLRGVVRGVEGAREERAMEGKVGGFSTLAFVGRAPVGVQATLKEGG